jgi:hypothetical protein
MPTGYEISFEDFLRLCSDHSDETAPLLSSWFQIKIEKTKQGFLLRDNKGTEADPEKIHQAIQADPENQGTIYRVAMTVWR